MFLVEIYLLIQNLLSLAFRQTAYEGGRCLAPPWSNCIFLTFYLGCLRPSPPPANYTQNLLSKTCIAAVQQRLPNIVRAPKGKRIFLTSLCRSRKHAVLRMTCLQKHREVRRNFMLWLPNITLATRDTAASSTTGPFAVEGDSDEDDWGEEEKHYRFCTNCISALGLFGKASYTRFLDQQKLHAYTRMSFQIRLPGR
jgi:hypothetical protein